VGRATVPAIASAEGTLSQAEANPVLLSDENFSNQKNHRPGPPGFSFLAPSYIIRVPKDKKSLDSPPVARIGMEARRRKPRDDMAANRL